MTIHQKTEFRTLRTGAGALHRQRRFFCSVHGYFDLFVFPDAAAKHRKCNDPDKSQGVMPITTATAKAA